jgi:5'-3' exoribonuclease 1
MGLPGFFKRWATKRVKRAFVQRLPRNVSSLAFDANGILHKVRALIYGDAEKTSKELLKEIKEENPNVLFENYCKELGKALKHVITLINPLDTLIIAIDGVAPMAKLHQQRTRRERASLEQSKDETFDKNSITPGTPFMIKVDTYIQQWIEDNREILPTNVIYSSHLVPGEGEHKIMDYYRSGNIYNGYFTGNAHVLYGLDADLVMLSLISPLKNIFLMREDDYDIVSIEAMKNYLRQQTFKDSAPEDFVLLMFLMGNDFLPTSPSLAVMDFSIDLLVETIKHVKEPFTKDGEIRWEILKEAIKYLAINEYTRLRDIVTVPTVYKSRYAADSIIKGTFYPNRYRLSWYQNTLGEKGPKDIVNRIHKIVKVPIEPLSDNRIIGLCEAYLKSFAWNFLYYSKGLGGVNYEWAFSYYNTPLLKDLHTVLESVGVTTLIYGYAAYDGMITFNPLHQLVSVIPLKSIDIVPEELRPLWNVDSPVADTFIQRFDIELDGKNKLYQGVAILPFTDKIKIMNAVSTIPFTANRAMLWLPTENKVYELSKKELKERKKGLMVLREEDKNRKEETKSRPTVSPRGRGGGYRGGRRGGYTPAQVRGGGGESSFSQRGGRRYLPRGKGYPNPIYRKKGNQ